MSISICVSKDLKQPCESVETWSLIQLSKNHPFCKALLLRSPWGGWEIQQAQDLPKTCSPLGQPPEASRITRASHLHLGN